MPQAGQQRLHVVHLLVGVGHQGDRRTDLDVRTLRDQGAEEHPGRLDRQVDLGLVGLDDRDRGVGRQLVALVRLPLREHGGR